MLGCRLEAITTLSLLVAKFVSSDKNDKKLPEQRFPESIKEW